MLRAILVDMDGTLIDTESANGMAYCQALAEHGISVPLHEFQLISRGRSYKSFMPDILGRTDNALIERIATRKRSLYSNFFDQTIPNRRLIDLLRQMRVSVGTALVTTASRQATAELLKYHRLEDLFDTVVTGNDVINGKPSPEPYVIAAQRLGADASECLVLEDSEVGISAGTAFGAMVFALVSPRL